MTGCELVVVAADGSALTEVPVSATAFDESAIVAAPVLPNQRTRTLVLGWNQRATSVIRELDAYAVSGSELLIVSTYGDPGCRR